MVIPEPALSYFTSLPFSFAETEIRPNSALLLASVHVELGRVLRARYLSLHVPRIDGVGNYNRVSTFRDAVFVGIYGGHHDVLNMPAGSPIYYIGVDGTGYAASNLRSHSDFSSPGHYSLMLVNNTREHTFSAVVSGSIRLL